MKKKRKVYLYDTQKESWEIMGSGDMWDFIVIFCHLHILPPTLLCLLRPLHCHCVILTWAARDTDSLDYKYCKYSHGYTENHNHSTSGANHKLRPKEYRLSLTIDGRAKKKFQFSIPFEFAKSWDNCCSSLKRLG